MFRYLPEQASELAHKVDAVHNLIMDLSVLFTVLVTGAAIYFAIRYRKKGDEDHETPQIRGSHTAELIWTAVPTIVSLGLAVYGIQVYREMRTIDPNALEIAVTAQKWHWEFEYGNGKKTKNQAVIPVDTPVKFLMTSRDVLHSFFVPSMREKSDVVPGQYTYVHFKPIKTGDYNIFCTEYCGDLHSQMLAKLKVVSESDYNQWLNDDSEAVKLASMSSAEKGEQLYSSLGCNSCHKLTDERLVGPGFQNIYGRKGTYDKGTEYAVDENYIKESILYPAKHIVDGYANAMLTYKDRVTDEDIGNIIAFMKTLDGSKPVVEDEPEEEESKIDLTSLTPAERGERLYKGASACQGCHSLDGTKLIGPSFKGIYGRAGKLEGGKDYVANDEYLKKAILQSQSELVEGYGPLMPNFEGQLSDDQVADIIEFLKTVK